MSLLYIYGDEQKCRTELNFARQWFSLSLLQIIYCIFLGDRKPIMSGVYFFNFLKRYFHIKIFEMF